MTPDEQLKKDDELKKLLHDSLVKQYDLVFDRRKTLSGQAAQLLTFAGIIQTVLVGLLVALATSPDARTLLRTNPNYASIVTTIDAGFAMYIVTSIVSIIAYFDPRWLPAPIPIKSRSETDRRAELENYYQKPETISMKRFDMELSNAIEKHRATNSLKYGLLVFGYLLLIIAISLTAYAGYLIVQGIQ